MRTLVLLEDQWHPAEVLQTGLSPFARFGFDFHWLANTNDISAQLSGEYRIVILAKANDLPISGGASWVSEQVQQTFVDHVHRGGGLLVLHSGAAGYEDAVKLRRLMGGAFRQHPEQCLVKVEPSPSHPLTEGCDSFTLVDEQYVMDLDDRCADVFLSTTSEHGKQPAGWIRRAEKGRVCVMTLGHNLAVWLHPSYQQLLLNALRWCGNANDQIAWLSASCDVSKQQPDA